MPGPETFLFGRPPTRRAYRLSIRTYHSSSRSGAVTTTPAISSSTARIIRTRKVSLAELPKGAAAFKTISLGISLGWPPGHVQWDGEYMTISVANVIYRLSFSGSSAKVVGSTQLPTYWNLQGYSIVGAWSNAKNRKLIGTAGENIGFLPILPGRVRPAHSSKIIRSTLSFPQRRYKARARVLPSANWRCFLVARFYSCRIACARSPSESVGSCRLTMRRFLSIKNIVLLCASS